MNGNGAAVNTHVRRLDLPQVNSGNDLTMYNKQQAIAYEELGEVGTIVFAGNDFFHRVAHGFEALELLNLSYHRGLIGVDDRAAAAKYLRPPPKPDAGDQPHDQGGSREDECGSNEKPDRARGGRVFPIGRLNGLRHRFQCNRYGEM